MPDPNTPTTGGSDTTPNAPAPVAAAPVAAVTPSIDSQDPAPASNTQANREAIAEKYQKLYGGASPSQPSAVTDPAAQAVTPAPAIDPVVAPPDGQADAPPDRISQLEAQLAQVTALLTNLAAPAAAAPGTPAPAPTFVDLLRAGDFDAVENLLADKAAARAESSAVSKAVEMVRIENDITNFITDLRGKNPDLLPLEDLVTTRAAQKLEVAQKTGKIKTTADYITAYKTAVNSAADEARKIVQSIRAAGVQQARVSQTEVLSTTTVPPTPVEGARNPISPPAPESVSDYMERRKNLNYKMRGIAVA